jgi:hypothetical protein
MVLMQTVTSHFALPYLTILLAGAGRPVDAVGAPPDPQTAVDARVKNLRGVHDPYAAATVRQRELTQQVAELPQKLAQGQIEYAALVKAAQAASSELASAQREAAKLYDYDEAPGKGKDGKDAVKKVRKSKAEIARDQQRLVTATANYQQAVQSGAALEKQLGQWNKQLQEAQKALPLATKKLAGMRGDPLAWLDFSRRWTTAEHRAVAEQCDSWLADDPQDEMALLSRAAARRCLGQTAVALDDVAAVIRLKGAYHGTALALQGLLTTEKDDDADGLRDFTAALRLRNEGCVYLLRGLANLRLQRFNAAESDLKRAASLDKENPDPNRLLALFYSASADHRDAEKASVFARRACDLSQSQHWADLDALAAAQAEAGRFEDATTTAQQAADLTFGDKRQQCLDRKKLYEQRQPLRLDWK